MFIHFLKFLLTPYWIHLFTWLLLRFLSSPIPVYILILCVDFLILSLFVYKKNSNT